MNIDRILFEKDYDKMVMECKREMFCWECKASRECCKYKAIIKKYKLGLDEIHPEFWDDTIKERLIDIRLLNS